MPKIKVQAQHLQPGDIVGSGAIVTKLIVSSVHWPSNKVQVSLEKDNNKWSTYWGKYTMINVERSDGAVRDI